MGESILSKHLAQLGRKGGKAWLKTMTLRNARLVPVRLARKAQG
jgi:hypothetical protein